MYNSKCAVGVTLLTLMSGYITSVGASLADFDPFTSPNGDGCVDPQGFRDCYEDNVATFVDCGGDGYCKNDQLRGIQSYEECLSSVCKTIQGQNNLMCWVRSCWNQAYSCEYQLTAMAYLADAPGRTTVSGGVPWYPAPDGADGSCSCNLGYIEGNQTLSSSAVDSCMLATVDDPAKGLDCLCCAYSQALSGLSICPGAELSFMDLNDATLKELASNFESPNTCAILKDTSGCESSYNITLPNVPVVNIFKLPSLGTKEVTNLPGNAFTDVGGEVLTISLEGRAVIETITLAAWNDNAGAATATGTGTGKAAGPTGTATGSAANSSATGAAGTIVARGALWSGWCIAFLAWGLW